MSKTKSDFLGESFGTARNRLQRQLLFKYVHLAGDDICYVCNKQIDCIEDFTVEHKEPWLHRENGVRKFWDLDNIAFSHRDCNLPHIKGGTKLRKIGPEGTAWCSGCQDFLPVTEFAPHKSKWNGLQSLCKEHKKQENKKRYTKRVETPERREQYNARMKDYMRSYSGKGGGKQASVV